MFETDFKGLLAVLCSQMSQVTFEPISGRMCQMSQVTFEPISGRMCRASAAETVDKDSIFGQVKPKTIKIGIHSFATWRSALKKTVRRLHRVR